MPDSRTSRLADLEARLSGPKRIALFGHRDVGKTTLLAMFYRQAAAGEIAGIRLAAIDSQTAEYLADRIAQLEAGQPMGGTLAETELKLRLYHGPARLDLIVKDYQGEHVALDSDEPIHEFFADCDAVLLCLDPAGSSRPVDRRRRQQEIERLLERYLERSEDLRAGLPIALVLTKFDRVVGPGMEEVAGPGATGDWPDLAGPVVDELMDRQYGMTRHALSKHVDDSAIFAVSSYGPGAIGNAPPAVLRPLGLEGPLSWLAERLESRDRACMEELWQLAARDRSRLERALTDYERRYPRSNGSVEYRARLKSMTRRGRRRRAVVGLLAAALLALVAAGYDYWGYQSALAFQGESANPPPLVARRWSELLRWHPTLPVFWPSLAREARLRQAEWTVRTADVRLAAGIAEADLDARLEGLKDQAPQLVPAIRRVEEARQRIRHDERWKEVYAEARSLAALDDPERPWAKIDAFLREFPETPRRVEALELAQGLKRLLLERRSAAERRIVDDLAQAGSLPGASYPDLIARARRFLADHPESPYRDEAQRIVETYLARLDEQDIERAREFSRRHPAQFAARIERYQDYLKAHVSGGRFLSEALESRDRIRSEWDAHAYRQAYDHLAAYPDDVGEVARRLREYLRDHPGGRFAAYAKGYLDWWDKVSVPSGYRVMLRRGEVDPSVGKYLAGGAPDLGVVVEVGGVTYGPSPVIRDSHRPIWDYTFPQLITWKVGDPVTIRIIDYDWTPSEVYTLHSRQGDPLAMRLLSGTIKPAKGGSTTLVFASDFAIPSLPRPE
jgi:hypothetical protein